MNGSILNRYVMGPGVDEPLTWYSGAGTSSRAWYAADNAGSVIATADQSGNSTATYDYGPYGEPITSAGVPAWGGSRYRYTGQIEVPGAETYYYKARVYDPSMGRFYQTDPTGTTSELNMYAYGGHDPINMIDPSGQDDETPDESCVGDNYCANFEAAAYPPNNAPDCGPGTGFDCWVRVDPPQAVSPGIVATISYILFRSICGVGGNSGSNVKAAYRGMVNCRSILPNGQSVGQVVRSIVSNIQIQAALGQSQFGVFIAAALPNGPEDFKNNFGPDKTGYLGAAGNFVFGAVAAGVGYSQATAELGAGFYATAIKSQPNFSNPYFEDADAAKFVPAGYATGGCMRY